jgi:putative lipoprotein
MNLILATAASAGVMLWATPSASAQASDPWFGRDKALHFGVSAALAGDGYAVGAAFSDRTAPRLATGAGLALAAGLGKEIYDLSGHGDASWRDLTWDLVGAATGIAIAWGIDTFAHRRARPRPAPAAAPPGVSHLHGVRPARAWPQGRENPSSIWTWTWRLAWN